ncbi:DUF2026 family protein [Pseudomonas segetis]|uniref:Uncharacterized protein n=1 Tax=Pseudomonas segetis TaxID=298908 RepID=A0A238Z6Q4_9PSED|nr:Protein of unknown function [Pseudomonas segetis]
MPESPYDMTSAGDFYLESNSELTHHLLTKMFQKPITQDLSEIFLEWCKRGQEIFSSFDITYDLGKKYFM